MKTKVTIDVPVEASLGVEGANDGGLILELELEHCDVQDLTTLAESLDNALERVGALVTEKQKRTIGGRK